MILAIDTSTAACSAALLGEDGKLIAGRDELIGRGHAERLMPMVAELLDGCRPDSILVGVGPGSFTGIRVGIAAAHGMAIGWSAEVLGMSSLALLAAGAGGEPVAAAMAGGHGELLVQQFGASLEPESGISNLKPLQVAATISCELVIGPAASMLVEARGWGRAIERWPSARDSLALPIALRSLPPAPVYSRPPDARVRSAA